MGDAICDWCLDLQGAPPYPAASFDIVLLDGPCSALGQRPLLQSNITESQLNSYSKLQKQLFSKVRRLLLFVSSCQAILASQVFSICNIVSTWVLLSLYFQAVEAVKPGGCIVYSTCTVTTAENESIVAWALENFDQIELTYPVRLTQKLSNFLPSLIL